MKQHHYSVNVNWTGNTGQGTQNYKAYQRDYDVAIEGKPIIKGSSDPSFRGDETRYNPEELFVASISSCHMLWFLHLCSENDITVISYRDDANGVMKEEKNGSGYFESIILKPFVTILEAKKKDLINQLHKKANQMCFIANSCNIKIGHEPVTIVAEKS